MPTPFVRQPSEKKGFDTPGKIIIKIIRQADNAPDDQHLMPTALNRKEQIVLLNTTVGAVHDAISAALFDDGK